nr:hypothetical protein [uncultured Duganella sp.]
MTVLRYTLLSDGSSDAVLMPIIDWLIREHFPDLRVQGLVAERLETSDRSLKQRIPASLASFPCDVLFVHRDAEGDSIEARLHEIELASADVGILCVPVIPVRMTEAWLFSDEAAIRSAAYNAHGKMPLNIPLKRQWESLPDPKNQLFEILITASGRHGRALGKFNPHRQRPLVALRTSDFSGLRGLSSFDFFESQLVEKLKDL